ncbi:MAG: FtsB family cell division protein [Candidatus Omnitrophota bacterium]
MLKKATWLFLFAFLVLLAFLPSYTKLQDLKQRNREFEEKSAKLQQEIDALSQRLYRLEHDPDYLEALARDKMGVAKKGEVIYKIEKIENRE